MINLAGSRCVAGESVTKKLLCFLVAVMGLAAAPSQGADQLICTLVEETRPDVNWKTRQEFRIAAEFKKHFGAAIDTDFVPWTPDEIAGKAENFVSQKTAGLKRVNTFAVWANEPPYFDFGPTDEGFAVFIARSDGRLVLFESDRRMQTGELVFAFSFFLSRSLADCGRALRDPEFASLQYRFAVTELVAWCAGDGKWFKSTICNQEPLRLEIERVDNAYRRVRAQAAHLAPGMEAREAYFVVTYLKDWAEAISRLKDEWCQSYQNGEVSCLD